MGGYINNVNIEAGYHYNLNSSGDIYYYNLSGGAPAIYSYSSNDANFKAGYGIIIGRFFRLTPQIGIGVNLLKGTLIQKGFSDPHAGSAYMIYGVGDVRFELNFLTWLGVHVTPAYYLSMKKSELYSALADKSEIVSAYNKGFGINAGIHFTF